MTAVAKSSSSPLPLVTTKAAPRVFLSGPSPALKAMDLKARQPVSQFMPIIVLIALPETQNATDFAQGVRNKTLAGDPRILKLQELFEIAENQSNAKGAESEFTFGDVAINFSSMEATRKGKMVFLRPMEFKTLKYFTQNARRVISRDELLNEVWGYENYPCTRTVDNHILQLRQKLEKDPSRPAHLQTVHGVGYKFLP